MTPGEKKRERRRQARREMLSLRADAATVLGLAEEAVASHLPESRDLYLDAIERVRALLGL